jgi:hypothetical protein
VLALPRWAQVRSAAGTVRAPLDPNQSEDNSAPEVPVACGRGLLDDGAALVPETTSRGLARDLPETALRAASPRHTTQPSTTPLACGIVWVREASHGIANHPHINGMQGVRGSNPLSSTPGQRPDSASTTLESLASGSRWAAISSGAADPASDTGSDAARRGRCRRSVGLGLSVCRRLGRARRTTGSARHDRSITVR